EDMHPSGVQFGLSRGLLQLRGEEVLLSDELVERISVEAQIHLRLGRPPIQGNFLVDITVQAAQDALGTQQQGQRQEIVPFFTGLNRTMYYTFCRLAERAGLAHKEPRRSHDQSRILEGIQRAGRRSQGQTRQKHREAREGSL